MSFNYKKLRAARTIDPRPKLLANAIQRVCSRRRWCGLTLAKKAGVPPRAAYRVLRGTSKEPSFWTVARLAKAAGLDLNYLAGLAPEQKGRPHGSYTVPKE